MGCPLEFRIPAPLAAIVAPRRISFGRCGITNYNLLIVPARALSLLSFTGVARRPEHTLGCLAAPRRRDI